MKSVRVVFIFFFIVTVAYCSEEETRILDAIQSGVEKLTTSSDVPNYLKVAVEYVSSSSNKETFCKACNVVINNIITFRRTGASKESMQMYLLQLCYVFRNESKVACQGYTDIEIGTILYIIDNKTNLTPERVCAIYFQAKQCKDPGADQWEVPLPPPRSNDIVSKFKENDDKKLQILHLTDFHYDPYYKAGSNAKCDKPLCCQDGTPAKLEDAAGFWGDYNVCDMPRRSVDNLLEHIQQKHLDNVDFIYYTGDIISHRSWDTSKEENSKTIKEIYDLFATTFGNKTVYPILGNHEPHPTDFYSSDNVIQDPLSTQWIFNLSVQSWSRWLPASTYATIGKGGFYSVLVKPGFRIVALNSNVCFTSNLWLFYEDKDPYGQLAWLVNELYKAEQNSEKVHILSHIPPGEILCHRQWSNQFHKIVNRFADTIAAQFNGHTHIDEFRVFYNTKNSSDVINVAFNGGSFTTFVGFNSNYRIYQVSSTDASVENFDQFIYNLTNANMHKSKPDWYKLYSFKEAYNLPDLSLPSFGRLIDRMSMNSDLLYQYFRFLVRDSDVSIKKGCDDVCLKQLLCYITAVETDTSVEC